MLSLGTWLWYQPYLVWVLTAGFSSYVTSGQAVFHLYIGLYSDLNGEQPLCWTPWFAKRICPGDAGLQHLPNSREERVHASLTFGYCSLVPRSTSRTLLRSLYPATITAIPGPLILASLSMRRGHRRMTSVAGNRHTRNLWPWLFGWSKSLSWC